MKAMIYARYGPPDVVELRDWPKPTPADHEILIRVRATTVSSADWRARSLAMPPGFGLFGPLAFGIGSPRQKILGTELAGDVERVGRSVKGFREGDAVFAFPGFRMGSHAEYRCMPADGAVAIKPSGLSYEQAAALSFGGATMLHFFLRAALRSGERVLVNGGSGAVGSAAVQLAKHMGANVVAVCSAANAELLLSIGADEVIDYTTEDFASRGDTYDVIVDAVGNSPFARSGPLLTAKGRLIALVGSLSEMLKAPLITMSGSRRILAGPAAERPEYVHQLRDLAGAGGFTPVVGRVFPFEQARAAHAYVDQGRKRGSVVLTLAAEPNAD